MARQDHAGTAGAGHEQVDSGREAEELSAGSGVTRTPLFTAQHSERYARQQLIRAYEAATGANLVVMLDQIFPPSMTFLEELIFDCDKMYLLLASPGGDGETAIRTVHADSLL